MRSVTFNGNAPTAPSGTSSPLLFGVLNENGEYGNDVPKGFGTVKYYQGTTGFETPTWWGAPTEMLAQPAPSASDSPQPSASPSAQPSASSSAQPSASSSSQPSSSASATPTNSASASPSANPSASQPTPTYIPPKEDEIEILDGKYIVVIKRLSNAVELVGREAVAKWIAANLSASNVKTREISLCDITLQDSTGKEITKSNFPSGGIDIIIPFPSSDMAASGREVKILHYKDGFENDPTVDTNPSKSSDGWVIHVDSLSPFAVISTLYAEDTPSPSSSPSASASGGTNPGTSASPSPSASASSGTGGTTGSGGTSGSGGNNVSGTVSPVTSASATASGTTADSPKTNDVNNTGRYIVLLVCAGIVLASAVMIRVFRKKKRER